jgi:hypothetical protein
VNVFDCETYKKENGFIFMYCISYSYKNITESIYYSGSEGDLFISFLNRLLDLKNSDNNIVFFIHNINFDGILIMDSVFKNNINFSWFIRDSNIYYIKLTYLNMNLIFKCSYKFIPMALKDINFYKIKKKIFPYDFVNSENLNYVGSCPEKKYFNKDIKDSEYEDFKKENSLFNLKKVVIDYCENDVKLTSLFLKNLLDVMGSKYAKIFNKSFSAPSLSYKIFFNYWNSYKIEKKILVEEDVFLRKSYFGGRCEVFGNPLESEFIHYFDFSGMYEQCMKTLFPVGKGSFKTKDLDYNRIGFHVIKFKSFLDYPVLPMHSGDDKLIFPNGVSEGCYWYEEIILFVQEGGVVLDVVSSYEYSDLNFVFNEFITEFSSIKKMGGLYKIFGKLMINSLYGSFAMSDKNYSSVVCYSESEFKKILESTDVIEVCKKNSCYIVKILINHKSYSIFNSNEKDLLYSTRNISYASIISSKARIKLYKAFKDVLASGARILYCDTDSIVAVYNEKKLNQRVGEVVWQNIWKDAVFINPKFYIYIDEKGEEVIKIKGISNNEYSFDFIKKKFYNNDSTIIYKDQLNFKKENYDIKQEYITKLVSLNSYDKRIFSLDKKKTTPIFLPTL